MKLIRLFSVVCVLFALLSMTGCITVQKKEYRFTIKPDGTGEGIVRYVNILSSDDNGKDVSFKDFAELVTDYLDGTKFEEDYPAFHVTGKKLVEDHGQLVGEVNFTFTAFDSAGFLRREKCDCCPVMYFINTDKGNETVSETNGKIVSGVAPSPFVEWEPKTREFTLSTTLNEDTSNTHSMLAHYKTWVAKK